ncbi:hypothetical protein B0H13DRAFT_2108813 [Mycena leptocephala]|nr:hypothetical protein B0H13DRAFT_2108813 [Mycena leptocephala]
MLADSSSVSWSDVALSEQLIACIVESRDIKRALFPPVGPNASTSNGGGKTKVAAHWQLCVLLLGDNPKYKDAIEAATTPKEQLSWANRIKNRLRTMGKTTRGYIEEMGQTGAGIERADDIDTTVTNSFTTKWQKIAKECPWFFDMRDLIGQRPNLVPVGLGHSDSAFDPDVMNPAPPPYESSCETTGLENTIDDDMSSNHHEDLTLSEIDAADDFASSADYDELQSAPIDDEYRPSSPSGDDSSPNTDLDAKDEDADVDEVKSVPKGKGVVKPRKTPANPGRTKPAPAVTPAAAPKASKKGKLTEFAEIAKTEEVTRQKELDLAAMRVRQSMKALEVKGRLAEQREERRRVDKEAKREERRAKLRIKQMKLEHAQELRLSRIHAAGSSHTSHAASFFDSDTRGVDYGSSEYAQSDADSYLDSLGSMSAGPSTATTSFGDNMQSVYPSMPSLPPFDKF